MSSLILAVSGAQQQRSASALNLRHLVGPGLLVAVGYVDPGNWATDIAGGAHFGYQLLSVVVLASVLAMVFQTLVARVVLATGEDLASLSARHLPRALAQASWLAGEAAILATAFAEMVGGAIAFRILFDLPLPVGIALTGAATAVFLSLSRVGEGAHEKLINVLIGIVAVSFLVLLVQIGPDWSAAARGVAQTGTALRSHEGLVIALGILGATLMPHNLYLHAGMLAERVKGLRSQDRALAGRIARNDTLVSLGLAMLVNAAIMIVAAASLSGAGANVDSLIGAHAAMRDALGVGAATIFAIALYAAGQSSAMTGMMAGRILSKGFRGEAQKGGSRRRIVARLIVAVAGVALMQLTGRTDPDQLLVFSQVVLGVALPFALVPLVILASRRSVMGAKVLSPVAATAAALTTAAIIGLNLFTLF